MSGEIEKNSMEAVRERLASERHEALLERTWEGIRGRLHSDGYFPESLTGAYGGMYPRTVGALVQLLLELDDTRNSEAVVGYCLEAIEENDLDRVPHVIGPRERLREPLPEARLAAVELLGPSVEIWRQGQRAGQGFTATEAPLRAVEIAGYALAPGIAINTEIQDAAGKTVFLEQLVVRSDGPSFWGRLEFPEPPALEAGGEYRIYFHSAAINNTALLMNARRPEGSQLGAMWRITAEAESELPGDCLAIVLDTGEPQYRLGEEHTRIMSDADQIDGQAHLILAWALLALERGPTEFEDRTYPLVARLMRRTLDEPYLTLNTGWRVNPGLVMNRNLEHSRDTQFWHAFDFLTQSFTLAAGRRMVEVARRRGDSEREHDWAGRLRALRENLDREMVRELGGKPAYAEMVLPTGRAPEVFPGVGWLNLAPLAAGWENYDEEIFRNTIDFWHREAEVEWDGPRIYSNDWLPEDIKDIYGRSESLQVISKVIGWDLLYCLKYKQYDRIVDMLDFLDRENDPEYYAEAFGYAPETGQWHHGDPGNGEQACWLTWAMLRLRRAAGLGPLP